MRKIKKLLLLLGVILVVATPVFSLVPIFTGKATAAESSDAGVSTLLKSYIYIRAIARCIEQAELVDGLGASLPGVPADQEVEPHNATDWRWFSDTETYLGQYDTDDANGKKDCHDNDWMQDGFKIWGWDDPATAICYAGFKRENQSNGTTPEQCVRGSGNYERNGSNTSARDQFLKNVNKQFYGKTGSTALPTMSPQMAFLYYRNSFLKLCDATARTNPEKYTDAELYNYQTGKGNNHLFKLLKPDGKTFDVYETIGKDAGDHVTTRANDTNKGFSQIEIPCGELAYKANQFADEYAAYVKQTGDKSGDSVDVGSGDDGFNATCGATGDGFFKGVVFWANPLNWLICPLITGLTAFTNALDNQIVDMLCINEKGIFGDAISQDTSTCGTASGSADQTSAAYKSAWNVFRVISLGLLAIAGLIMILSQTSGFDFVDAYTLRKTLPRIFVAAIAITLSWPLLAFLVGLANDLGIGVRGLIYSPFREAIGSTNLPMLQGGGEAIKLLLSGYLVSLGAFGFLLLLASGALAVFIAFAVLTIRNILVILLLITAPIAIAAYVLPNTQNIWKTWWSFLSKALMVFPIITAFIAIGHVFSAITLKQGGNDIFSSLVAFAAYFAPYFLLPATFRFAGGALATIGGFANDRGRGAFDMLRNKRNAIQADRYKRAVNGKLWDPNSKVQQALRGNKIMENLAAPHKGAAYALREGNVPIFSNYGRRLESSLHGAQLEQSQKLAEHWNKHGANDKFFSAMGGMYEAFEGDEHVRKELLRQKFATEENGKLVASRSLRSEKDINAMADILAGSSADSNQKAAFALRANASYTANTFRDAEMNYANTAVASAIGRASHGFLTSQDSADSENLIMKEAHGDKDFAHAATVQAQAIGGRSNPDNKAGYGTHYDARQGKYVTAYESDRAWAVLDTIKPGDYSQAKGNIMNDDRMGGVFKDALALQAGDAQREQELRAKFTSFGMSASEIDSRIKSVKAAAPAVRDTLFSMAGQYSQADPTAKAKALEIISNNDSLKAAFAQYNRGLDPTVSGAAGIAAVEDAAQQQNQNNNNQSF